MGQELGGQRGIWAALVLLVLLVLGFEWAYGEDGPPRFKGLAAMGLDGKRVELGAPSSGAVAIVFYSTECPISNAYSPTLGKLVDEFRGRRVRFVAACVDPDLSEADQRQHARDFALRFQLVRDTRGELARKLGVSVTPEAVVLDDQGVIRYRGRIDDEFARRGVKNANPATSELRDALRAVLEGKDVAVPETKAVGCPLPEVPKAAGVPTYSGEVAAILNANCRECHRRGRLGPFPLETYEQACKRASDIANVVEDRRMPPWKPVAHFGVPLQHSRALSDRDRGMLLAWAEGGAPLGDPSQIPAAPHYQDEWEFGEPDLVLDIGCDFAVPSSGSDIYRCFVLPTNLPRDMAVEAVDFRPGNAHVVHHILAYVDVSGKARERDQADPGPGYTCFAGPGTPVHADLTGWAPGARPSRLPEGVGRSLPRGSDVIVQVHYHPSGKPETDRSRIGLYFSKKPIRQTLHWRAALNQDMVLPAGKANIQVEASWELPLDVVAYSAAPHMHLLGRDMTMSVTFPDGRVQDLLRIDDWDFNWQQSYMFEHPLDLPKGSVLKVVAHYDNSASNPRNPNRPPREVRWGEATTDEMCIGFLAVAKKGQDLTRPGEKDDLLEICERQIREGRARRAQPGQRGR